MIKKRGLIFLFLIWIFIFPLISAVNTEIKLKVPSYTEVHLGIAKPGSDINLEFYKIYSGYSDYYGDISFTHSGDQSNFNLNILLKKNGKIIHNKIVGEVYPAGTNIYLEVIPEGYNKIETFTPPNVSSSISTSENISSSKNESLSNEEILDNSTEIVIFEISNNSENSSVEKNKEEIKENKSPNFLGFSISQSPERFSRTIIYSIAIAFLIGATLFLLLKGRMNPPKRTIKIRKLSDILKEKKEQEENNLNLKEQDSSSNYFNNKLKEAESKIEQAKTELDSLKKKQRIKELQEELRKLSSEQKTSS